MLHRYFADEMNKIAFAFPMPTGLPPITTGVGQVKANTGTSTRVLKQEMPKTVPMPKIPKPPSPTAKLPSLKLGKSPVPMNKKLNPVSKINTVPSTKARGSSSLVK